MGNRIEYDSFKSLQNISSKIAEIKEKEINQLKDEQKELIEQIEKIKQRTEEVKEKLDKIQQDIKNPRLSTTL